MSEVNPGRGDMRIGVVEVGSRAAKLMVADFEWNGDFRGRATDSYSHGLNVEAPSQEGLSALWNVVQKYRDTMKASGCDRSMIYGTEMCRRILKSGRLKLPEYLVVLTPDQEAVASWTAGFMCVRENPTNTRYTVMDQGGGSTEIVSANWTGATIDNVVFDSIPSGNQKLRDILLRRESTYQAEIAELVNSNAEILKRHTASHGSELFIAGSVPTKLAHMKVRRHETSDYNPSLVNNVALSIKEIYERHNELIRMYNVNPDRARQFVDARKGSEEEYRLVISGAVFWMWTALKLGYQKFRVSGYGTRHGMGFLVRRGLI